MKKKILPAAIALVAVVIICIFAFSGKDTPETPATDEPITVNLEPETTKEPLFSPDFDKRIKVVLPIEVVDKKYAGDLETFAEENGYYSIEKKGENHVKIEMREYSYKLILTGIGMKTVSGIGYIIDSGDYPYFKKLAKYNSDFSEIIIAVNKEEYNKAENKDLLFEMIAFYGLYYQDYSRDSKGKCAVTVCEEGTNILIETRELTKDDLV